MGTRCLYNNSITVFVKKDAEAVFGSLCDNYHGDANTMSREAWKKEIELLQDALKPWEKDNGDIIF